MKKRILVYRWGSLNEPLLCRAIEKVNGECMEFTKAMKNYHADAEFAGEFIQVIHANDIQAVVSYDYFPLISMICEINHIPYLSWIYDCPQYTLQSKTLTNSCNHLFCFDRAYAERLKSMGAAFCCHYPLAGIEEFSEYIRKQEEKNPALAKQYQCDVSFVGNLYNEKKNRLRGAELTPYTAGYVEGLIQAQLLIYGCNFLKASLPDTVAREVEGSCHLALGGEYQKDIRQMAADAIGMEVSAREREMVLNQISREFQVRLYTSSKLPPALLNHNIQEMGYADYQTQVPLIYRNSKINLNITSKTIETGIPQRVFDILSCGGFCLSNYQPEMAEYFTDGEELVMYTDKEDLLFKVDYYLKHEEERAEIAQRGYEKVKTDFDLEQRVRGMLERI